MRSVLMSRNLTIAGHDVVGAGSGPRFLAGLLAGRLSRVAAMERNTALLGDFAALSGNQIRCDCRQAEQRGNPERSGRANLDRLPAKQVISEYT